jgi:1-acyl-sn-glycerol-3-phosphate acyltransferase
LRLGVRLAGFLAVVAGAFADWGVRIALRGRRDDVNLRAQWLSRWSRRLLRVLEVRVAGLGLPPQSGLLVSNHLGYLDVLVLAAVQPCVFVAKTDVRHWPVLGLLARLAGTLFVRRDQRTDVARLNAALAHPLNNGAVVVVFPEGTSSDGRAVLPFHSALLGPAADGARPVTPAWIGYRLEGGSAEDEVCYWRDMVFVPHFLNLLTKRRVRACLVFGDTGNALPDRKRLARELRDEVVDLGRIGRGLLG